MMSVHGSAAAAFACLQPGGSGARPETKSDTPDAPPLLPLSRQGLACAVAGLAPAGRAQALADALADCLDGNALCLSRLGPPWSRLACDLPPAAWTVLDGLAGEGGIARVVLPQADRDDDLEGLAAGLAVLPSLDILDLPVPRYGLGIDLSALRASLRPLAVRLHCVRAAAWQVTVPQGCRVVAFGSAARQHLLFKPRVSYVDSRGQATGESHALPGVPYMAKPPASIVDTCKGDAKAARLQALALCTNGRAQFDGPGEATVADPGDRTIWCRHIACQVGEDWRVRRGLQQVGMPAAMSYEPYASAEALRAHVKPATQALYDRDIAREAVAVFTDRGFGEALQAQCEALSPGQDRVFMLDLLDHAMALELRRKGRHCIVTCYDPNISTLPLKLLVSEPSQLAAFSLRDFVGSAFPSYVPLAAFVTGALFAAGSDSERGAQPCRLHGFSEDVIGSREGLFWLLHCGATGAIDRSVEAIVAGSRHEDTALLLARLSTLNARYSGMFDALNRKRQDTADAYVQAILRHALPVLGAESAALLLQGSFLGQEPSAFPAALERHRDFIAAYTRRVLATPGLDAAARRALLTLPDGRSLQDEAAGRQPAACVTEAPSLPEPSTKDAPEQ